VHSKNAYKGQKGYKKKYKGQGKQRWTKLLKFVKNNLWQLHLLV
jgi:hypothetical protein